MVKGQKFNNRKFNKKNTRNYSNKFPKNFHKNKINDAKNEKNFRPRQFVSMNNLKEDQVGITEYIRNGPGFTGVIKARFSDFQVNEVDLDGNEVRLTNQDVPETKELGLDSHELESGKNELSTILTEQIWGEIKEMLKDDNSNKMLNIDINVTDMDKEKRTKIHKILKEEFGSTIVSTTASEGDKKFIRCSKAKRQGNPQRSKWLWEGEYVYFVVHKENVDTVQAASDIALNLRLRPSAVNYAGTKDKRAKTSQMFCVKKREPSQIMKAAKQFSYMKIGNFQFKQNVLKLGELKGNRFRIVLRHVNGDDSKIKEALEDLKNFGFINYYGLQRFGNCASIPTYEIGIALLKGDYKEACELIMKPREGDMYFMKEVREHWWKNRNSAEASSMIKAEKFVEKKLLDGLAAFGENDYANALRRIPRNMLLLYTHSYQSLIWNKIASRRIKEFGLKLIVGDLVYSNKDLLALDILDVELDENEENTNELPQENTESFKDKVKPLTQDDIESGKFTIFDIVLPLPGYDITYPPNLQKLYEELLSENGLSSEKLKHNVKTYSLTGAYRKLLIKPENLNWEYKHYNSPTSTLITSDLDFLNGIKADDDIPDGKFKALLLDFILPSSSYATMILRELLKADTSAASQSKIYEEETSKHKSSDNEENIEFKKEDTSDLSNTNGNTNEKRKLEDEIQTDTKKIKLEDEIQTDTKKLDDEVETKLHNSD